MCEHRPTPGAGYWCYLDQGHGGPHSDLTITWNEMGELVNGDGSLI